MPKVSVLMPVFNGKDFIDDAIKSILDQTYSDLELLIIDDGSTDDTLKRIEAYNDRRIRLISNGSNIGIAKSLNKGLNLISSKYIVRMDCDDISLPTRIEKQVSFMDHNPEVGVCGTWMKTIGKLRTRYWKPPSGSDAIRCFFPFKNPLIHPSVILRREMLLKYDLMYSEEFHHAEDLELWSRCARYFSLSNIKEVLVYYRIHNQSIGRLKRNIQKDSSNRVHKRELIRSGLLPVADCHEVLNWINNPLREEKKPNRLHIVEYWLDRLRDTNSRKRIYPERAFSRVLGWIWYRECLASRSLGIWTWRKFQRSSLNDLMPWEFKNQLELNIRCLIRK